PIIYITPTSIIINNIESSTLYSIFKLPFGITSLSNLESRYNYLIIDEKSILNIRTIYFVDNYLR
ncbi:hypothetical protein QBC45DRAFT_316805, partial [Copromyces sp. CBS 386.78]